MMNARQVVNRLELDINERSGQVREFPGGAFCPELFIAFPGRGSMWVQFDGRRVTGWSYHGAYFAQTYGLFSRLKIRRAVRAWLARKERA